MGDIHSFAYVGEGAQIFDPHLSIFLQPDRIRVGAFSRVDGLVRLQGGLGLHIGEHVHIASLSVINAGGGVVRMGNHSGCSNGVVICGGMPDLDYLHVSAADPARHLHPLRFETVIGEHVVIFANAVIRPGVTLGDGAIIGAGAVVTHDIPRFAVAFGNPARVVRYRNSMELLDADTYLMEMAR